MVTKTSMFKIIRIPHKIPRKYSSHPKKVEENRKSRKEKKSNHTSQTGRK